MPEHTVPGTDRRQQTSPFEPRSPSSEQNSHRRLSALDGIRAFAVLAVLLYHAGISWLGGGLLGVDIFFVLSGYLITSLLCRELVRTSKVRLRQFWAQRARRLLPALFVLLLGVAAYVRVFASSLDVGSVRADALATLTYVSNWHFILSDQGYFAHAAAPSPLLHTWTLAVEEQYYLIWPLVALFVVRRWGIRMLAVVAGVGAVMSAVLMASMHTAGFSIDRLYFGTDTRAQALLVGSFLGAVGSHRGAGFEILPVRWTTGTLRRLTWTVLGVGGAIILVWASHALGGQDPSLYGGGYFVVAVAAACVILSCVTYPTSILTRLCSLQALVFIGRISYGLYLYHWPLYLVIDHAHTGLSGLWLLGTRLATTFFVATLSFFLLEEPIRTGQWFRGKVGIVGIGSTATIVASALLLVTVAPATTVGAVQADKRLPAAQQRTHTPGLPFTDPVRFVLVGDSVAATLAEGLGQQSAMRYGVDVVDRAALGCDLDTLEVNLSGAVGPPTPGCTDWRSVWSEMIARDRPEVVGLLVGRWEVSDHLYGGSWVHIGQQAWDDHLTAELNQAFDIFSSKGARVVAFTMPYVDPPSEAADGTPFSENDPMRIAAFNSLLRSVVSRRHGGVTVIDLNKQLDPGGHFQSTIAGNPVRWSDGIHITLAGGAWLQPDILPLIAEQGLLARSG